MKQEIGCHFHLAEVSMGKEALGGLGWHSAECPEKRHQMSVHLLLSQQRQNNRRIRFGYRTHKWDQDAKSGGVS